MSKKAKSTAMLEMWRPPPGAGEPVGCIATTYTFDPSLFDEQCLARFLSIESEPNREDLAFLLERESQLGRVYAGVLVDYTMAGVEHSLRWDVLPVRVRAGKQHAKVSLLAWSRHVRVIITSANLSEPGYRKNYEAAVAVDFKPEMADKLLLADTFHFLERVMSHMPGADSNPTAIVRARTFLTAVARHVDGWIQPARGRSGIRQQLAITMPESHSGDDKRSTLSDAIDACRKRGGSPDEVWIASPFFDNDSGINRSAAALCKAMARGGRRTLRLSLPLAHDGARTGNPRLAAPKSLWTTPQSYQGTLLIETLPVVDGDNNHRPWHAKMLMLQGENYSAVMVGSSNFTTAGMGIPGSPCNIEANLITTVDRTAYSRQVGDLKAVWPACEAVKNPDMCEWQGSRQEESDETQDIPRLPEGFVLATYRAGNDAQVELRLSAPALPSDWLIVACSSARAATDLVSAKQWKAAGCAEFVVLLWNQPQPPDKLEVRWAGLSTFMALNVDDARLLPKPAELGSMSADEMLRIIAATDPSAAFRTWAKRQSKTEAFDEELDSATPADLDPLRRFDLQQTFLHRIRNRARVFLQLRKNLERPAWGTQSLEWRLRGLVGIEPLADLYLKAFHEAGAAAEEALLTLADFLLVLTEVEYQQADGMLSKTEFLKRYSEFLSELAGRMNDKVAAQSGGISESVRHFWKGVINKCQE